MLFDSKKYYKYFSKTFKFEGFFDLILRNRNKLLWPLNEYQIKCIILRERFQIKFLNVCTKAENQNYLIKILPQVKAVDEFNWIIKIFTYFLR